MLIGSVNRLLCDCFIQNFISPSNASEPVADRVSKKKKEKKHFVYSFETSIDVAKSIGLSNSCSPNVQNLFRLVARTMKSIGFRIIKFDSIVHKFIFVVTTQFIENQNYRRPKCSIFLTQNTFLMDSPKIVSFKFVQIEEYYLLIV